MPVQITFIRHGQTDGNAAGRWQGHSDSSLTELGRRQAKALAARLSNRDFDLVVASDLGRTQETAAALGRDFVADARWREPDLGSWENQTTAEIMRQPGDGLAALLAGEDVALGGGERLSDALVRTRDALDAVVDRVDGDGSVAIVSHGMALLVLISDLLEARVPSPLRLLGNTALSEVVLDGRSVKMVRYNDNTHLGDLTPFHFEHDPADTEVLLVRHAQTTSNLEGRWAGHQEGELSDEGHRQIKLLAGRFPHVDAVYASPLRRAAVTAEAIASSQGIQIQYDDRLKEISFGKWEGMTRAEIKERFPDAGAFFAGHDVPRGGTGETFQQVRKRMRSALSEIANMHPGEKVAVVSHGGATRAWASEVVGLSYETRERVSELNNTGWGRATIGTNGASLLAWNLIPHLETS